MKRVGHVQHLLSGTSPIAGPFSARSGATLANAAVAMAVVAVYVALEWLSFIHEYKGVPITPWNPGLGLVFAFIILYGLRYAVALFLGVLIAEVAVLRTNLGWHTVFGIAVIIALGYGLVAGLARDVLRLDSKLSRLRDVATLLVGGAAGAVVVAVFICLLLLADHRLDLADVLTAAGPLLIGDIIGIAVITPLTLRVALHPRPWLDRGWLSILPELALFIVVAVGALWFILGTLGPAGSKFFFLLFLPAVVAAVRHGIDGACVSLAIIQLGLVGLLHAYGYETGSFAEFQLLMLVLSATVLTVGVVVTERRHADDVARAIERQLRAKEDEAAQAARLHLVGGTAAALAHEINQPMTAARALARAVQQLLRGPDIDFARVEGNLAKLIAQIDHAGEVVRRMRDFLRRGRPRSSTIAVGDLLSDALALAGTELAAKGIDVAVDASGDLRFIHGDAVQLQEVLLNLVRNAADAIAAGGAAGGRIKVVVRRLDDPARAEIAVIDNGPGVAPAVAERLFDPLVTSKSDGLGLGLSICVSIVEAHGGRIWLQSGEPGTTEFRFSVPLEADRG